MFGPGKPSWCAEMDFSVPDSVVALSLIPALRAVGSHLNRTLHTGLCSCLMREHLRYSFCCLYIWCGCPGNTSLWCPSCSDFIINEVLQYCLQCSDYATFNSLVRDNRSTLWYVCEPLRTKLIACKCVLSPRRTWTPSFSASSLLAIRLLEIVTRCEEQHCWLKTWESRQLFCSLPLPCARGQSNPIVPS